MNRFLLSHAFAAKPFVQVSPRAIATIVVVGGCTIRLSPIQHELRRVSFLEGAQSVYGLRGQIDQPLALLGLGFKLPNWFKVPTPLGTYNPDWAVLVEKDGIEKLYFVVETKHSLYDDDIRDKESKKIACGAAHFKAIAQGDNPAIFKKATKLSDLLAIPQAWE